MLKVGFDRVWFDPRLGKEIKEAITKEDLRKLVSQGVILIKQKQGVSRGRARAVISQKRKGRHSGKGSRKGNKTARLGRKEAWVQGIRAQRELFTTLLNSEAITPETYKSLRIKAKGGFFRSRRHIKLYLTENNLWKVKSQ